MAKPRAYGSPRSIEPVEIDPINLVYQVHAYGPVTSILPYEFGSPLQPAQNKGNAATYSALIGMTLLPGEYATCLAQGLFRFGGTPTPKITADIVMPSGNALSDIAEAILLDSGVNVGFIGDFSAFDAVPTNVYLKEETQALELLFQLFRDAGGYLIGDSNGVWQCGRFYNSTKTPLALKSDRSAFPVLLDWKEDPTQAPVWRVRYGYDRCWGVHSDSDASPIINDLVGDLGAAQEAATEAQDTAATAAANADAANARLASMANDNVLDRADKFAVISDYQTLIGEQPGIDARAAGFSLTTERTTYNNAITALTGYLTGLSPAWNNTSLDTPIVGSAFRQRFEDVRLAKQVLLNRFAEIAAQRATVAGAEAGLVNTNIAISGGTITGIGTGNGTPVANGLITVDGNGVLSGIGTANINVDNRGVVTTGTLAARPATGSFVGQTYLVTSGASLGLLSRWSGSAWVDGPTRNTGSLADLNSVDLAGGNVTGTLPVLRADNGLRNNAITVDASGLLNGIGTADINVDNRVVISTGTLAARPASGTFSGQGYFANDVGRLFRWSGSAWVNASDLTAQHTAAAITGQAPWATSTIPTARLNNLNDSGVFNSLANISARDLNLTTNRAWTNLFRGNGSTPITDADAITNLGTAAAIAGQGALATRNEITASGGSAMRFTDNLIPDNEYRDLTWWGAASLPNVSLTDTDTANWEMPRLIQMNTDRDFDFSSQFFTLERGSTYRIRVRVWNNNGAAGWTGAFWPMIHIPSQAWFSLRHGTGINPDVADANNAIVALGDTLYQDFYFTPLTNAARQIQFRFKSTARGSHIAIQMHLTKVQRLGRDLIRSDTNLPYQTGDIQTNLGVASAISGQSPWATSSLPIQKVALVRPNIFPYPFSTTDGRTPTQLGWQNATTAGGGLGGFSSPYLDGAAYVFSRPNGGAATDCYPFFDMEAPPNLLTSVSMTGYGNANSQFIPYIEFLNASKNSVLAAHNLSYNAINDRWEVNGVSSPANTAWIRVVILARFSAFGSYQDVVWWGIKVERGSHATPLSDSSLVRLPAQAVEYNNGQQLNLLRPAEFGSNVTESRVASAVAGQGDLATRNAASLPFGANSLVNTEFTRGKFGWNWAGGGFEGDWGVNLPSWHGHRNVMWARVSGVLTNGDNRDLAPAALWNAQSLSEAPRFALPVQQGDRVYASVLAARHRCNFQLWILTFNSTGVLIGADAVGGGVVGGGGNGDPASFERLSIVREMQPNARWAIPMYRMLGTGENEPYIFFTEPAMGKLAAGQTAIPAYVQGRGDPNAEVSISISGPNSASFNYTSTGDLDPAAQMPATLVYRLNTTSGPITSGITWQYRIIEGTVNSTSASSNLINMTSSAGAAQLVISNLLSNTAQIEIVGSTLGVSVSQFLTLTKVFAAPPTGGGGGGGPASASQTSGFSSVTSSTYASVSSELQVTSTTTTQTVNVQLTFTPPNNADSTSTIEVQVERWNGSAWVAMGAAVSANTQTFFDIELNRWVRSSGSVNFSRTATITAGSNQRTRVRARLSAGTASHTTQGTLTLNA